MPLHFLEAALITKCFSERERERDRERDRERERNTLKVPVNETKKYVCLCVCVCVVYFNQCLGARHFKRLVRICFFLFLQHLDEKVTKNVAKISIFVAYFHALIDTKSLVKQAPFKTSEDTSSDTENLKNW